MQQVQPDEIYNLAAQSHVAVSFEAPEYTANADALGTLRLLEAIRILGLEKKTRFYQASTSELFGLVQETPQTETTPFYPRCPYAVAKLYAYWITVNYREAYGMYACNGILFNHESPRPRRDLRHAQDHARRWRASSSGLQDCLYLGNLDALRDWGHARDYVEMQWLMLQQEQPEDFVIATGVQYSVRDFVERGGRTRHRHALRRRGRGEVASSIGEGATTRSRARCIVARRSALLPSDRSRDAAGRSDQGAREARLEAARSRFRRAREGDGARGPRDRAARRARQLAGLQGSRTSRVSDHGQERTHLRGRASRAGRLGARAPAARARLPQHRHAHARASSI